MLLCVVEQSTGEQDGLLPLGAAAHDGVGLTCRRVREQQPARRHSGTDTVDAQLRALLQRVIIVWVFKRQRQGAGVDEIPSPAALARTGKVGSQTVKQNSDSFGMFER